MNKIILRDEYLQTLKEFKDKDIIKIVTGIRRCGKSTLMQIFQGYLKESGVQADHIIAINFEDYDYEDLKQPRELYKYIKMMICTMCSLMKYRMWKIFQRLWTV